MGFMGKGVRSTRPRVALLVFAVYLTVLTLLHQSVYEPPRGDSGDRIFTVTIEVTYRNLNAEGLVWNLTEDDRTLGLFVNNDRQMVYLADVSQPVERFAVDVNGNPTALVAFPESGIGSGANVGYRVAYRITLKPSSMPEISEDKSGTLGDVPSDLRSSYCGSEGPWRLEDPALRTIAFEAAANETAVLGIVKRFILWIKENVRYKSPEVPLYPKETLTSGAGDCDDQANLLITFCRTVGIPAYLQIGCIYMPSRDSETTYWNGSLINRLTKIGWHGWAMVYIPPWGWLPVDLTYVPGDLRSDPLSAVTKAAVVAQSTVLYASVVRSDYVAASRSRRDFVVSHGFIVVEHDIMDEIVADENGDFHGFGFLRGLSFLGLLASVFACMFGPWVIPETEAFLSRHTECL